MIFAPDLIHKVVTGKKTQTRRPFDPAWPKRFTVGQSVAVQPGRGQTQVARIRLTKVETALLGEIKVSEARKEGFKNREQFVDKWYDLYGYFDTEQKVWVLTFELEEHE